MAYVPGFSHDVFISYAHVDNKPLVQGEKGWITSFHESLEVRLQHLIGRAEGLSIWRDPKLRGNDSFDEVIAENLRSSAILIAVLSPNYIESTWCLKELEHFCRVHGDQLDVGHRARVFKVVIWGLPREKHPPKLERLLGYEFFERKDRDDWEDFVERDPRYRDRFEDVARDVSELLKEMKNRADARVPAETAARPPGPYVYLAEVTDDLDEYRDQISRTLRQRGVGIFPVEHLPQTKAEAEKTVRESLKRSVVSIHLVGPLRGKTPIGDTRSYTEIQCELASAVTAEARALRQIIWMAPNVASVIDERQRRFLEVLRQQPDVQPVAEVLAGGLEELKEIILSRLFPSPPAQVVPKSNPVVYVCHEPGQLEDRAEAAKLKDYFRSHNFDVNVSAHGIDPTALRKHHEVNLQYCDALMIVYGTTGAGWVLERAFEAKDAAKQRRRPFFAKGVYEGPPLEKAELGLDWGDLVIISCRDGFQPHRIEPFLQTIQSRLGV